MKKIFYCLYLTVICLTLTISITAQKFPALPELKFAEIVNKEMFLGDRWSYMESGQADKPVIIALHGAGDNSMAWRFQFEGLSKKFRVIAWNAPGYFLTDGFKTESPGCQDYADALADLLQALKLEKVYVAGNSFGSRVAQCFGMHHPEKVIKIALIGVSAGVKDMSETDKNANTKRRTDQIKDGPIAFSKGRVSALVGKNTSPQLIEIISGAMKATNKRAFLQVTTKFAVSNGYSPKEVAEKLKSPVLMIAGEDDAVNPIEIHAKMLHQELKNSELVILKGIGHLPHLEAPKKVNELLIRFFR